MNNGGICSPIPTGDAHDQFSPIPFLPPPYAPPQYNEISNDPVIMQSEEYPEENAAPHIIIDPGELPPPYSTLDYNHVSRNGRRSSRSSRGNRSSRVLEVGSSSFLPSLINLDLLLFVLPRRVKRCLV